MIDRSWVHEAIAQIEADIARSADTHLIKVELPAHPGIDLYLKDEFDPSDRQPEAPAGALAVPLRPVQRLDRAEDHAGRGLLGLDRGLRGLFRAAARAAVRGGDAAHDVQRRRWPRSSSRADGASSWTIRARSTRPAGGSRPRPAGTISTSSPMPSGRPTGAATTTSPRRCSPRCGASGIRCRPGWCAAPARAAPRPRSGGTSATGGCRPCCAWSTRSGRCSTATAPTGA